MTVQARKERLYRALVLLIPLSFAGMFALLWIAGFREAYDALLYYWGVTPVAARPFADIHSVLASAECHRLGIDVTQENPCDFWQRPFLYPPIWLLIVPHGLTAADTIRVGIFSDLLCLACLPLIAAPKSLLELMWLALASTSPMVVFALERANPDAILFSLVCVTVVLLTHGMALRALSYAVFLFAAALKFYPLSLMLLVARERLKTASIVVALTIAGTIAYGLIYADALAKVWQTIPQALPFGIGFSAQFLPLGAVELFPGLSMLQPGFVAGVIVVLTLTSFWLGATIARIITAEIPKIDLTSGDHTCLVAGSILVSACYFAGRNIGYRGIFLLLVLAGMGPLARRSARLRAILWPTMACILVMMWSQFLGRIGFAIIQILGSPDGGWPVPGALLWAVVQLMWWWTVSVLLGVVLWFLSGSQAFSEVRAMLHRNL